jgi:hypothetical protein
MFQETVGDLMNFPELDELAGITDAPADLPAVEAPAFSAPVLPRPVPPPVPANGEEANPAAAAAASWAGAGIGDQPAFPGLGGRSVRVDVERSVDRFGDGGAR